MWKVLESGDDSIFAHGSKSYVSRLPEENYLAVVYFLFLTFNLI